MTIQGVFGLPGTKQQVKDYNLGHKPRKTAHKKTTQGK